MAWLILGVTIVIVVGMAILLCRELPRWQEGDKALASVAPLRLLSGTLLGVVILLLGIGWAFLLPHSGSGEPPGTLVISYWLFIGLLTALIVFFTLLDMVLVRHGYRRREDEAFRDVLLGAAKPPAPAEKAADTTAGDGQVS